MPPHLWRCAGLRGHGGRLGRCLLAETLGPVPTGCPQEAAAEEIEVRAAKHGLGYAPITRTRRSPCMQGDRILILCNDVDQWLESDLITGSEVVDQCSTLLLLLAI